MLLQSQFISVSINDASTNHPVTPVYMLGSGHNVPFSVSPRGHEPQFQHCFSQTETRSYLNLCIFLFFHAHVDADYAI